MVKFKVAIPSYNRYEELDKLTLETLISKNIDPSCIDIFVANDEEYDKYKKYIPKDKYNEIIITAKGKNNAINHIRRFYKKGQRLINIDDDIQEIYYGYNTYNIPLSNLEDYSNYIFKMMKKYECALCGILRTNSPYHKKNTLTINTYSLCGGLYWTFNNPTRKLDLFLNCCEDTEFSLKNAEYYGKMMLSNEISIIDASRDGKLTRLADDEKMAKARVKLAKRFPNLIKYQNRKVYKNYIYPIHYKRINKTIEIPTVVKKW